MLRSVGLLIIITTFAKSIPNRTKKQCVTKKGKKLSNKKGKRYEKEANYQNFQYGRK